MRAIEQDSAFALAHYRLGYVEWWTRGRREETQRHIRYALDHLDRIPQKERYLVRAIQVSLDSGFEAQLPVLKEMRALYPDDKEMLFGLGDAEFHSMQYDSAVVHFRAALAVDPNMDRALQHLTWTYMRLERFDDALKTAERWVQAAPSAEAYEYLAMAHFRRDDAPGALQILEAVRKRYPGSPRIPLRIAVLQFASGRPRDALLTLDDAERLAGEHKDWPSLYEIGAQRSVVIYPYLGRYRDAFAELERGRELLAESLDDSTYIAGLVLSRASLEYWAYQDPRRSLATLGSLEDASKRYKEGDYVRAEAVFSILAGDVERARELVRTEGDRLKPARVRMLAMLESAQRGDCAGAVAIARELPALAGYVGAAEPWKNYFLAVCHLENGAYPEAIALLRSVVDAPKVSGEVAMIYGMAWLKLGVAYEGKGEAAPAVTCYKRVIEMLADGDPDLASTREARQRLDRLAAAGAM
jgi:tetratricopeptide (TPR) repeat protein